MQEHIKRLAEEAGAYLDIDYPDTIRHVSITPDQLIAFGEAVARECSKLCEEISDEYQEREGRKYPEMKTDAQSGASECDYKIRAHFGIS
jgi:hypothetical protein